MTLHLRHTRRSVALLALSLVGVFFLVPSAQAHRAVTYEHLLILSTSPSDSAVPVAIGSGPIHAKGFDKVLSDTRDRFVFPQGAIGVTHKPTDSGNSYDAKNCLGRFWEKGTYVVTGGSGAYSGASGSGHYLVRGLFVACSQQRPQTFMLQIHAYGPLQVS
jgi:hypothetical protein